MPVNPLTSRRPSASWAHACASALVLLAACASDPEPQTRTTEHLSINSCDDGVEACEGNERCESCLIEGGCADGPSPVWTGSECVCTDDNPANCVYEFCCALGYDWNPDACECLPCASGSH